MLYRRSLATVAVLALLVGCEGDDAPLSPEHPPIELGTGWVQGRGGQPVQITFEVHNGRAIFEGDIDLGAVDKIPATREEALDRAYADGVQGMGVINAATNSRWPSGKVPYVIDPALPMQSRVTDAIAHIEANNPGVKFSYLTSEDWGYIYITRSTECNSAVGRTGGRQVINLADGCGTGTTIHELLHALGMWHEQSRCDRDNYVEILWENIEPGREHNFNRYCSDSGASDVFGYDEGSIMHYGPTAFSRNGQPTIRSRRGRADLMGQTARMSATDVATVNQMYTVDQSNCFLSASATSVPSGRSVTFSISLADAPFGSVGYWYGTRNGTVDSNHVYFGAVPGRYTYENTQGFEGTYTRQALIRDAQGNPICMTNSVTVEMWPTPTCSLSVSNTDVPVGGSYTFSVSGNYLPVGTIGWWYGTKNGATDIDGEYMGGFPRSKTYQNQAGWAGYYSRWIVAYDSYGNFVCRTNPVYVNLR